MCRLRRLTAVAVLGLLVVTTGCLGGGGGITQEELDENASYNWSIDSTTRFNVTGTTYKAVSLVTNGSPVEAYRITEFQGEQPVDVSAVRFRYPNGTVTTVNVSAIEQEGSRTVINPPADIGYIGYKARSAPKSFSVGIAREGSYVVVLPTSMRISVPVLGSISPGGAELRVVDDRTHLRWDSLDGGEISLQYYLERDFYLFAGLVVTGIVLAIGGVLYFRYRLRRLESQRQEAGIDVDD